MAKIVCEYKKKCISFKKSCDTCTNNTGKRDYYRSIQQNGVYGNTVTTPASGTIFTVGG